MAYVSRFASDLKQAGTVHKALCPFPTHNEKTPSFTVYPDQQTWHCYGACDAGGDVIDFYMHYHGVDKSTAIHALASEFGLERVAVDSTKRTYTGLADYASAHGIDPELMCKAGWEYVTEVETPKGKWQRPALGFKTDTGYRYRFLDGQEPRFWHPSGYETAWYLLTRALTIADTFKRKHLIICNGEASVLSAQGQYMPATCLTGGGERAIPEPLLEHLCDTLSDLEIVIAMDCDDKGRGAATKLYTQLTPYFNSHIVDLGLGDGGDLADFVRLHGDTAYDDLLALTDTQPIPATQPDADTGVIPHTDDSYLDIEVGRRLLAMVNGELPVEVRSFPFPFQTMHKFGQLLRTCTTKKVCLILGASGDGKTQLLETMVDNWALLGVDGIFWGAEWDQDEMIMRRWQRYSRTITYEMVVNHLSYLGYKSEGLSDNDNYGTPLNQSQVKELTQAQTTLEKFRGSVEYHGCEGLPSDVDTVFDMMERTIERRRKAGKRVLYVVFDYVQLLESKPTDASVNRYEYAFERVKDFARRLNVYCVMTSQVNKDTTRNKAENGIGIADAHWIRPDKANVALALVRQYYEGANNKQQESLCYYLRSLKSSLFNTLEDYHDTHLQIPLLMRPERLTFSEHDWRTDIKYSMLKENQYYKGARYEDENSGT